MRAATLAATLLLLTPLPSAGSPSVTLCGQPGQWLTPADGGPRPEPAALLLARVSASQVVLLGESHDSAEDHRWQLHTLAQLHARRPGMAIGFEMFPRRLQPVLDRWVAGELSEQEFLKLSEWEKVWGFDARDYLPLFHYARMNRIPMLALNVERSLPEAVDSRGWDAVPEAQREGLSRPAPPSAAYLKELRTVFDHHPEKKGDPVAFERFVEAQTVWDRAMAEVMASHLKLHPRALVAGILGSGHVRHGHGVAHQLKALGVEQVTGLMTWDQQRACADIAAGLADAVYVVQPPATNPPRLGIAMEADADGVRIVSVVKDSVAEQAGLKAADVVVEIAGRPVRSMQDLRSAVQRQAPGTWLPLKVKRSDQTLEIIARFPAGA
jgi:uncharacterized iron-regulated protein